MQKANKTGKRNKGVPQRNRRVAEIGKQLQPTATGRRKLRTGTNATTCGNLTPFALKPVEKELTYLDIESYIGEESEFGSVSVQLQLIEDLYPVVSSLNGFKELKITADSTPSKVLHDLLKQCDIISKLEKWEITKPNDKYIIQGLNCLDAESACFISIDFLAKINQSHPRLHEFLIYAFRLVSKENGIELLYEFTDGMYYEYLQERLEWDDDEELDDTEESHRYSIRQSLEYYGTKGIVASYNRLLRGVASFMMFKYQLAEFKPQNELEEIALPFLQAALELADTERNINDYCQEPWEAGEITPRDYFRVLWSWDDDDNVFDIFKDDLDGRANGCGAVGFCWNITLGEKSNEELKKDYDFINKVGKFFEVGNKMSNAIKELVKNETQHPPKQFR